MEQSVYIVSNVHWVNQLKLPKLSILQQFVVWLQMEVVQRLGTEREKAFSTSDHPTQTDTINTRVVPHDL